MLHEARDAGLRVAGIFGDHKLIRVAQLEDCPDVWPPQGELPQEIALDAHGYPVNSVVVPHLLEAAADPEIGLTFCHLNETDTIGHDHGPDAAETIDCVREADDAIRQLADALRADWQRTIVIVTSDHDMEARSPAEPVDLAPAIGEGLVCDWIADGSAAFARLAIGVEHDAAISSLRRIDGIAAWRSYDPDFLLLLAAPGHVFAGQKVYAGGTHGSKSTARTLGVVGGGHPMAAELGRAVEASAPRLRDWAPTIASILPFEMPAADGETIVRLGFRVRG